MYRERQDDRYGGKVPSKKRKAKDAVRITLTSHSTLKGGWPV